MLIVHMQTGYHYVIQYMTHICNLGLFILWYRGLYKVRETVTAYKKIQYEQNMCNNI